MSAGQTPTEIKRNVCVYCGSSSGKGIEYAAEAVALGRELVNQNLGLVYGGGRVGLMGLVADAVLDPLLSVANWRPKTWVWSTAVGELG